MTRLELEHARELASAVLERVTDCGVRLAHVDLVAEAPAHRVPMITDTSLSMSTNFVDDGVICVSKYVVSAEPAPDVDPQPEDDEDRWAVTVEMHGYWTLESIEGFGDEHAQAFSLAVGAMALHPYARAQIQQVVSASGYPAFTLDVLGSLMEPDEEDGLVDLDAVTVLKES